MGGLVKSIFFRNKSFGAHDHNTGRSNLGEKKRWSSVRSYLCGDEFNSVLAVNDSGSLKDSDALITTSQQELSSELCLPFGSVIAIEDSASVKHWVDDDDDDDDDSVKSSEATVVQPLQKKEEEDVEDNKSEATETHIHKITPISKLEDHAAVRIQTAFRSYMTLRKSLSGEKSQGNVSGTSPEAQTCNSMKAPRKRVSTNPRTLQNTKAQVLKIKQDWDDSTVSSTVSKSRIQNRIEAMTKRERALAYAFSQQLRICSKKKQMEDDSNIGWSWLERWMATRVPENIPVETRTDVATKTQRLVSFGIAGELESCASNDLPLQFESMLEIQDEKATKKNSPKSKRKSIPSYKSQRRLQTTKSDVQQQTKKAKKAKTTTSMEDERNLS